MNSDLSNESGQPDRDPSSLLNETLEQIPNAALLAGILSCKQASWQNVGPKHISGAMRQVLVDPTDRRRLYAVSANGGVWRLNNLNNYPAAAWQPLTDELSNLRFRTMAVAPSNGVILYAANSVKELRESPPRVYSEIYRLNTRGTTWKSVQQDGMGVVHRLVVHPAHPNVVFAATSTGLWRQSKAAVGVWTNLREADCLDVALDPDDSSIIYLGVREQGIFKSFTSGADWTAAPILDFNAAAAGGNRQIIKISLGRYNTNRKQQTSTTRTVVVRFGNEICINQTSGEGGALSWKRAVPSIMVENSDPPPVQIDAVPNFLDGGNKRRSDTDPRESKEWCNCVAVDPFDPRHILVASVELLESKDAGASWMRCTTPHEDAHSLVFDQEIPGLVYIANDGGVFSSIDGGTTWPSMALSDTSPSADRGLNFAVGLITSELVHMVVRAGRCIATIDHTGFILSEDFDDRWQFLFNSPDGSGRHSHENSYVYGCPASLDRHYIFNHRDRDDPTRVIDRLAQFDFTRTDGFVDPPASPFSFLSDFQASFPVQGNYKPEDSIYNNNFLGPFAARFSKAKKERLLLFGAVGSSDGFSIQSLRLAANGLTVTASATEATNNVEPFFALTFVPNEPDRAFAITQSGQLLERNFSAAGQFTPVAQWVIPAHDIFVSRLIAVPHPQLSLYALSQHGIGRFNDQTRTWTTVQVWTEPGESLMSLIAHPARENTLFLGTNRGVYLSENGGTSWHPYRLDMPAVPITELAFDQGYLYAATFGRGLWRCKPCPG